MDSGDGEPTEEKGHTVFGVLYGHPHCSTAEQEKGESKKKKNSIKDHGGTERLRDSPQSHSIQPVRQKAPCASATPPHASPSRPRAAGDDHRFPLPVAHSSRA